MTYLPGMKDGDDVAEGATTDSAVTGDVPGTLSAKARGLSKIWADVWDQVNHRLNVGSTITNASLRTTSVDGDNATVGTTTDLATALTLVGLLKAIKAALGGTLATRALSSGTDSVTVSGTVTVTDSVALPVVLPVATVTTLTPLSSVGVNNFPATQRATSLDGDQVTIGTTTDLATSLTLIGLLKAIKATLAGVLNTRALTSGTDSVTISGTVTVTDSVALAVVLPAAQVTTLTPLSSVGVNNFPATQPVSAASLPLPAGAASEAGHLSTIDGKLPALGQAVSAASVPVVLPAAQVTALTPLASVGVNNFPATQPVSAAALPLPAGAASEAGHLSTIDAKLPAQGQALATGSVPVVLPAAQVTALTPPTSVGVTNFPATQPISAASLPLPAGAASEAGHLSTIDAKTPALGQALAAASLPVVLPAAQVTALTPPAAIAGFSLEAGHIATIDVVQGTTADIAWVSGAGTVIALLKKIASTGGGAISAAAGAFVVGSLVDGADATQGATADAATANTVVGLLKAIKATLAGVLNTRALTSGTDSVTISGTVTVTDSVALAVVLPAAQVTTLTPLSSVGVNNFPATQPISAASLPLPAGAASEAGHLSTIDAKTPALGQALAAASLPVVLPAAQVTALTPPTSVGVNNFPATQPVSAAALPLPAGAASEAGHLSTIDAKLPAQGQALAAASVPVVLPAAQVTALTPPTSVGVTNFPATQPISATALPLPVGAATDGTDSIDANATQATGGVGNRGWQSTLVSLFRAGTAKVSIRLLTALDVVTITKTYTPISTEATANTRTAPGGTGAVYQTVTVPITMPAGFNPTELGLAGTLGPLTFATNGTPAGNVTLNLECQDASGRWTQIWSSGSMTANGGVGLYPSASIGSGLSTAACFTPTLRWDYIFQGVFTTASLTEQITLWGK